MIILIMVIGSKIIIMRKMATVENILNYIIKKIYMKKLKKFNNWWRWIYWNDFNY